MRVGDIASTVGLVAFCLSSGTLASPGRGYYRTRGHELDYTKTAEAAIDSMNQFYYDEAQGRWSPEVAWWLSGFALQDILDFMHKTGSRKYIQQARDVINAQKAPLPWWPQGEGNFRADSTDDTGWWALALIRMFDLTDDHTYLNISIQDEQYMYKYWTSECNGGMFQDIKNLSYKNAISNQLYMLLTASLHNRIPDDTEHLAKAIATWEWLEASGMLNSEHLFNDGLAETSDGVCYNNKGPTWTYNQGVILGALTELHQATKNKTYLTAATSIASAVLSSKALSLSSILTEPCEATPEGCNNDQQIFKGIFAKHLSRLSSVLDGAPYREYLEGNARSVLEKDQGEGGLFDVGWAGPFRNGSFEKQASAVGLFVGLI
ncbi:family 76 glycoside hydrolase [Cercophora newfieldiana]|uniref:Family 76 glycoside hydrolase n=1 Tax=Cercophora newfieldiana TaxID=92897 RepID=A0AA39Y729_9PEZI|nr:family 76 glycoside hydrolase [Cercophora newfieldiana]